MKVLIPIMLMALLLSSACGQSGTKEEPEGKTGNAGQEQNGSTEAAKAKPERNSKVVARINGVPIYEDELNGMLVDSLITDEILYQKGLKEGLDKKYEDKIRQYRMSLVVMEVKGKFTESQPPEEKITDEDLLEYYNSAKDISYTNVRSEEINFKDEGLGEQIVKTAKEGTSLQDIANDLSKAGSEVKVSDLGYDKKYNSYFDVIETGSVSEVIRKEDGTYSVMKIVDVKVIPFEQIKNKIGYILEAKRKGAAFNKYAREVAEENGFTVEIIERTSNN